MTVSFQSDQQNGRRQLGKEMKCCHQGTDYLCTLSFKTGLPVAPSCYSTDGNPRCLKAFPFFFFLNHPRGQLHDCLGLFTQQRGRRRMRGRVEGSCWSDSQQVALFTAVHTSLLSTQASTD